MIELHPVQYGGWANCLELRNASVKLIITTDVGPRVLFFGFRDGQNFFHNFPEHMGRCGDASWLSYGGHRLWYAPETAQRTYYPDNVPVPWSWDKRRLVLDCPDEQPAGIKKQIAIELDDRSGLVRIDHTFTNSGLWPVEASIWCISVMAPGGTLKVPQEPFVPHGGGPGETFLPARPVVLWPFARMDDPRFSWGGDFIAMRQDDRYPAKLKFGVLNRQGYALYELNGETFTKRYPCVDGATYPDLGCNSEFYTQPGFLEIESLSPLYKLAEGASATHTEYWSLAR